MPAETSAQSHVVYFDTLRAVAICAVVVLHTAAFDWYRLDVKSPEWQVLNLIDSGVRFCVPVFFMISGALFLDPRRQVTYRSIFRRSLPKIVIPFLVWSLLYAALTVYGPSGTGKTADLITHFILGHYHLWFLIALAGLYLATPLLRAITANRALSWYFVALAGVFATLLPLTRDLPGGGTVQALTSTMQLHLPLGYSVYFVLGYLLHTASPTPKQYRLALTLGALGVLTTAAGTSFLSLRAGAGDATLYAYLTPNVVAASVAVFMLAKHKGDAARSASMLPRQNQVVRFVSRHSFGAYLTHPLFQMLFQLAGVTGAYPLHPVIGVPLLATAILISSLALSYVIATIPKVGRYIVG